MCLHVFTQVMNQCQLEEMNPYCKEWAILALRNLTNGHEGNQASIAVLKQQGVTNEKELTDMNLKVLLTSYPHSTTILPPF
jgi:hypothetical protein